MNLEMVIKDILSNIDLDIKNNISFKKLLDEFLSSVKGVKTHYRIDLEDSIYSKIGSKYKNTYSTNLNDIILNVEYVESMDKGKIIEFTIQKKENYVVTFMVSDEEDITKLVSVEVKFDKDTTTWKVGTERVNEDGFYYEYNYDMFKFDKKHNLLNGDYSEELDKDFSDFFSVPLSDARKYRTNFNKYSEDVNKYKKIGSMNRLDNLYCSDKIQFGEAYRFNDLENYFVCVDEDIIEEDEDLEEDINDDQIEDYCDKIMSMYEESYKKIDNVKSLIKSVTGDKGLFTMSQNLIMNITSYITSNDDILSTKGFIIRKLDKYTLYYVYITSNGITHMSKDISLKEAQDMFNSHEFNKSILGLNEFFDTDRGNSLKLGNN